MSKTNPKAPDLQPWEKAQFSQMLDFLYPDGSDKKQQAGIGHALVYMGRARLGDTKAGKDISEHPDFPPEALDDTVTLWGIGQDLTGSEMHFRDTPPEESGQWQSMGKVKRGQVVDHPYFMREGVATRALLGWGAVYHVTHLQAGLQEGENRDALRAELLDYVEDTRDNLPALRYTRDGGETYMNPGPAVSERLRRITEALEDGDLVAPLSIYDSDLPEPQPWSDEKEKLPNPSPSPFDVATGTADVPNDPFTFHNIGALLKAGGHTPSKPKKWGDWTEDDLGRPVYRYQFNGPPYSGHGQLSVVEQIEAEQARKLLAEADLKAVDLYYLLLAYASDTSRRSSPESVFRIPEQIVFWQLGLDRRTDMSRAEKVQQVYRLNQYLNSFRVQLGNVTYNGERCRIEATSPTQLWDTYLQGAQETDLFGNVTYEAFQIVGREGAWASEFLHHRERGGRYWTKLLLDAMANINRGNDEWPRRIMYHLMQQFRINGGPFTRKAGRVMRHWCREDVGSLNRDQRKRRKQKLRNAFSVLRDYGYQIDDERLHISGRPFDEWLSYRVHFAPPKAMLTPHIETPGHSLPSPEGKPWNGRRIRTLRKKHLYETQAAFAQRFDPPLSQPTISTWENGSEAPPPEHEQKMNQIAKETGFTG